jgi:PAS domain S-box-containing protein
MPERNSVFLVDGGVVPAGVLEGAVRRADRNAEIEATDDYGEATRMLPVWAARSEHPALILASVADLTDWHTGSLLSTAMAFCPDVPVVAVGRASGKANTAAYRKAGAWVYLGRKDLRRLDQEVRRALSDDLVPEEVRPDAGERERMLLRLSRHVVELAFGHQDRVFIRDADMRFVYVNDACAMDFGGPPEQFIGRTDIDVWGKRRGRRYMRTDRRIMQEGKTVVDERPASGDVFTKIPILDGEGRPRALVTVKARPEHYRVGPTLLWEHALCVETAPHPMFMILPDATLETVNEGAVRTYGYTRKEMLHQPVTMLIPQEEHKTVEDAFARACAEYAYVECRLPHRRKDGSTFDAVQTIWPVLDGHGGMRGAYTTVFDITADAEGRRELVRVLDHVTRAIRQVGQFAESAAVEPDVSDPREAAVEQVARAIRADPCAGYDFRELAERHHMSLSYFRRLFRDYTGRPPYDYVLMWRMRVAARALRDTTATLKSIARQVGYDDPRQFSRMFKSKIGVSPTAFRAQMDFRGPSDPLSDD